MKYSVWLTSGTSHRGIDLYGLPDGTFEAYAYDEVVDPSTNGYSSDHKDPLEAMQAAVDCWIKLLVPNA